LGNVFMPDDKPPNVNDADLANVTRDLLSAPDLHANRVDRFFGQVQAIVDRRAQNGWKNENTLSLAAFIQVTYPRAAAAPLDGKPVADLDATNEPILGRLFLLNQDASQGYVVPLPNENPGELLAWLAQQSFSREPTVLIYRETNLLVERAGGAAAETTRKQNIRDKPPAATEEQLLQGLDRFHQQELITPTVCPVGVWLRGAASRYYVGEVPERSIQAQLRTFLNGWFRRAVYAECEDTTRAGRIDVRLLVPAEGAGLMYWAIVELKVVKSYVHTNDTKNKPNNVSMAQNAEAIAEGLRQAHEFGQERKCPPGYLEVFDLRKDKSIDPMKHDIVVAQFQSLNPKPIMNIRVLFGSARDARKAGVLN
jgi:hypothetical protein